MNLLFKIFQASPFFIFIGTTFWISPVEAFADAEKHWARECIDTLASRNLITGYPDGTFRPENGITRAEFAVLMLNAFPQATIKRSTTNFRDVTRQYWAHKAIQDAYQRAFFTGYPNNLFRPNQAIPRVQAIAVLADAINYPKPSNPGSILSQYYQDAGQVPNYAREVIAAASLQNLVVNYPRVGQLEPNRDATRGEVAALLCRGLHIDTIPPEYIVGLDAYPQQVRPLPGQLDQVPVFNSNSPELVREGGILLSTFPPGDKSHPQAHLNYGFRGRFDIFTHHLTRAETAAETQIPFYQGILLHNPGNDSVRVKVLTAASYLGTPDAPFISLPDLVPNPRGQVYSGPGGRVAGDILRDVRQNSFPAEILLPPGESRLLLNEAIPVKRAPASNGRSTLIRLEAEGEVYVANLAQRSDRPPSLAAWEEMLRTADLAGPRDSTPTPLDPPRHPTVFGRVAGVSQGSRWQTTIRDNNSPHLSLPGAGEAISYALGTLHLITLSTGQIQSAPMLRRYKDTAYFAHSNYGVEYNLTLPLHNPTQQTKRVSISLQTPVKDEGGSDRLLFTNPPDERIFFRGTVKVSYPDSNGVKQIQYFHLVQRRGQLGPDLATLSVPANRTREVEVDFIYPADVTPPQVLTVKTLN